jgi:site-specific DNA recombinase
MRRAAIYGRISDDPEGTSLGVTRQIEDCQEFADRRGWSVIGPPYVDNDISASRGKPRPAYRRLMADMESGQVQAVVVWALDRLDRRPIELETFMDLAESRGVLLASVAGDVDLSTEDGQFHARIMGAVAAKEARAIGRRIRRKQQELRDNGMSFSGGIRPFGFDYDRMTQIPSEVTEIRAIARRFIAGQSAGEIVRDLNERQVPTVSQRMEEDREAAGKPRKNSGRPWSRTSVRTLMSKPRLAGLITYKGEVPFSGLYCFGRLAASPACDPDVRAQPGGRAGP